MPIIIGDTRDEISKAKYKVRYTPIPIVKENNIRGNSNFCGGNFNLINGITQINITKTLKDENKIVAFSPKHNFKKSGPLHDWLKRINPFKKKNKKKDED